MDNLQDEKGLFSVVDASSSETATESSVEVVEEPIRCRHGFAVKNDFIAGINEGENSDVADRESKRLKMSVLAVDSSITDMQEEYSSPRLRERIINPVERSKSAEESGSFSLSEPLLCCQKREKAAPANDVRLANQDSNGCRNEPRDVQQLRQVNPGENPGISENNLVLDSVFNAGKNEVHSLKPDEENDPKSTNIAPRAVSVNCSSIERKLLVLDVNGLLVSICSYVPYDYDPDDIIMRKAVFKRPYCDDFLRFCFDKFNVGIWTSKTKRNMEPIIDFLFGKDKHKLLFCWDQSHCTKTGFAAVEQRHKPILLKKLKKIWDKYDPNLPWKKGEYNQTNTVLIDDSPHKALCNPQYTAVFPYTYHFRRMNDFSLGPAGDLRLYLEGLAMAENVQDYVRKNPFGQRPITERNLSWLYYRRVIEASTTPPRHEKSRNGENPS